MPLWILAAVVLPIGFILATGFIKCQFINKNASKKEYYLGVDLLVAALGASILHGLTYQDTSTTKFNEYTEVNLRFVCEHAQVFSILFVCGMLMLVASLHKKHENNPGSEKIENFKLMYLGNGLGVAGIVFMEYLFHQAVYFSQHPLK